MKEEHDAIVITLSQGLIQERQGGYKAIMKEWERMDGDTFAWYYKAHTAPKDAERIVWVFWSIGGKIRWRCRLLQIVRNQALSFPGWRDGQPIFSKNWLVLFDFAPIPRTAQVSMKGFQGFRYISSDEATR